MLDQALVGILAAGETLGALTPGKDMRALPQFVGIDFERGQHGDTNLGGG